MKIRISLLICSFLFLTSIIANAQRSGKGSDTITKSGEDTESVDIGYGKVKRRNLTTPVDRIDGEKLKNVHYDNIYEMIRGKAAGVEVNGTSIRIRNATSLGTGSEPLFVVDGVPVNTINNIDPEMVRSIEVLKGAAASIYGTRGGNGVILINLKKGK